MTVRKDFLLNQCGDVKIENGDTVIVDEADQIRQSWLIHIRTIKGEMLTNVNDGVPWFGDDGILQKWNDGFTTVKQIISEQSLLVPGVIRVNGVEVEEIDKAARTYRISADCTIEGEERHVFNYQGRFADRDMCCHRL